MSSEKLLNHFEINAIKRSIKECEVISITLDPNKQHMLNYNFLMNFEGFYLTTWNIFHSIDNISKDSTLLSYHLKEFSEAIEIKINDAKSKLSMIDNFSNNRHSHSYIGKCRSFLETSIAEVVKFSYDNYLELHPINRYNINDSFEKYKHLLLSGKNLIEVYNLMLCNLGIDINELSSQILQIEKKQDAHA